MNLKDLEYFKLLASEKSFTKVAQFFGVSQPTVTYAIKRLEEKLGVSLIIRDQSHKRIILTQAGKILESHALKVFQELDLATTEISRLKDDVIQFGLPPIIGNFYFPKLSTHLFKQGLMEHIHIVDGGSHDLHALLLKGEIDIALLGSFESIENENLITELLFKNRFMIVVSKTHPLADRKSVSFAELKQEKFVLLDEHYVHLNAFRRLTQHTSFEPHIIYKSSDLNILKGMIRENVGIGFLTEIAVNQSDDVVCIRLDDELQISFNIFLIQRKNALELNYSKQIAQVIIEFCKSITR